MLFAILACAPVGDTVAVDAIGVRWLRGHDGETWEEARAGLWWALSNLGATPPADEGAIEVTARSEAEVRFVLDLGEVGLDARGLAVMEEAFDELANSDEAAVHGAIDLGRLLMRTLYDPWRYYAATGACPTLAEWEARLVAPVDYAVTVSTLVEGHRLLTLQTEPATVAEVAFRAAEGDGSLADGSFAPVEFEVVDAMDNGQQRFAVYDLDGALLPAATHSPAGQPGKCMWCHEWRVQPGTGENPDVDGYLPRTDFLAALTAAQDVMEARRVATSTSVDHARPEVVHDLAEALVEDFLSPPAARVAAEWGWDEEDVRALGLATHDSEEYPERTGLYTRAEVDAAWPEGVPLPVHQSSRETPAEPGEMPEDIACD